MTVKVSVSHLGTETFRIVSFVFCLKILELSNGGGKGAKKNPLKVKQGRVVIKQTCLT